MPDKNWQFELEEYIKQGEPERVEKSEAWQTAIGLQAIDGLKTSEYLLDTAKDHIEGKITIDEAQKRIHSYYEQRTTRTETENETKEADIVSARITKLLGEKAFQFSPAEWLTIHRRLFEGVFDHAGQIRKYNISKKEWILNGETVIYADFNSIKDTYNDLQKGIHSTTKFLELFFSNLLLGTNYELKNRYMHVDFVDENTSQSAKSETPKCQIDTLKCTLEELAVLDLIKKNPSVKQTELAEQTGKSVRSIKRITDSLKEKQYLRRVDGKRYGKWEVLA